MNPRFTLQSARSRTPDFTSCEVRAHDDPQPTGPTRRPRTRNFSLRCAFIASWIGAAAIGCVAPSPSSTNVNSSANSDGGEGGATSTASTCGGVDDTPSDACCEITCDTSGSGTPTPPQTEVDACPDGFARGTPGDLHLVHAFSPSVEGVAVCPDGDVFVSQPETGRIFRVPLDGAPPELWTTLSSHQPLGMDCGTDGALYIADFGTTHASVLRVASKDDPGTPMPNVPGDKGFGAMNGVAFVDGVGIYATDASNTWAGRVVLFTEPTPGVFAAKIVKSGLPFPNDVDVDRSTSRLDVSMTLNSQIVSYAFEPDGSVGGEAVAWNGAPIVDAVDGLVVAADGDRYIAHYLQGKVTRASDGATVAQLAEPRSLAFRGGTLVVTAKDGLYAVDLAVCGAP